MPRLDGTGLHLSTAEITVAMRFLASYTATLRQKRHLVHCIEHTNWLPHIDSENNARPLPERALHLEAVGIR